MWCHRQSIQSGRCCTYIGAKPILNDNRVDEGKNISANMLGQQMFTNQTPPEGLPVDKVYVVEQLDIGHEYYLAITTDRANACPILVISQGGGTGIEELAAKDPKAVVKVPLKYTEGVTANIVSQ